MCDSHAYPDLRDRHVESNSEGSKLLLESPGIIPQPSLSWGDTIFGVASTTLSTKHNRGGNKGMNTNEKCSRRGCSLTDIHFASLLLTSPVKIFEAPSTLPLSFVAAPKSNTGTGGNAGLLKYWATLKLGCFALAGCCCYWHNHESPKKSEHFN